MAAAATVSLVFELNFGVCARHRYVLRHGCAGTSDVVYERKLISSRFMHVLVCVFACVATYVSDPLGPPGAVGS